MKILEKELAGIKVQEKEKKKNFCLLIAWVFRKFSYQKFHRAYDFRFFLRRSFTKYRKPQTKKNIKKKNTLAPITYGEM